MGVLALALGKTLGELEDLLTEDEWAYWREFFRLYPFDDVHRFHRPAALIAARGAKNQDASFKASMEFLAPTPKKPARQLRPPRIIKGNPK